MTARAVNALNPRSKCSKPQSAAGSSGFGSGLGLRLVCAQADLFLLQAVCSAAIQVSGLAGVACVLPQYSPITPLVLPYYSPSTPLVLP